MNKPKKTKPSPLESVSEVATDATEDEEPARAPSPEREPSSPPCLVHGGRGDAVECFFLEFPHPHDPTRANLNQHQHKLQRYDKQSNKTPPHQPGISRIRRQSHDADSSRSLSAKLPHHEHIDFRTASLLRLTCTGGATHIVGGGKGLSNADFTENSLWASAAKQAPSRGFKSRDALIHQRETRYKLRVLCLELCNLLRLLSDSLGELLRSL